MDLRQYLRIFRAHWLGMLLLTLIGVAAALGWALIQPKVYAADSSAIVQVSGQSAGSNDVSNALVGNNLATSRVKTYVDLGSSRSVAERVIEDLSLTQSPSDLARRITVTNPLDTVSIRVSASAATPEEARDIAEAWVRAMAKEVNNVETGDPDTRSTVFLQPVDSAKLPTEPSSPNTRLALVLGGLLGLAVAVAYALLRYTLDRRIRNAEGVERETGVAVVGAVPDEKSFSAESRLIPFDGANSANSKNAHLFAVAEAMRELRTNITFMDVDNPPRVIVVTSPLPGDGKSTTASNLAIALAASGQHVVLIDGDLRRPMVANVFGLVEGAGLTDVLAGRADIVDVAQRVGNGNLVIVPAGKVPPNPSEVLGSQRMKELLDAVSREAFIIVDAPPLLPVTDAALLAHSADGAIVVSTVGRTTFEVLGKALANLDRADARALGIVLNRVPRRGAGAAYYGYQYHGDYYRRDEEPVATTSDAVSDGPIEGLLPDWPAPDEHLLGTAHGRDGGRGARRAKRARESS